MCVLKLTSGDVISHSEVDVRLRRTASMVVVVDLIVYAVVVVEHASVP
jgi:hypothetical protein